MTKGFYVAIEFGQARSFLSRQIFCYVVTELIMVERLYLATEYFMLRQSVAKWRGFVLRQKILCCDRKFYVAT